MNSTLNDTEEDDLDFENHCEGEVHIEKLFVNYAVLPVFVIMLVISFFTRRKHLRPSCCFGRPGIVIPVNLIEEHERLWAFAAAFGLVAYKVLLLFDGVYFYKPEQFDDPVWMKKYGFVRVFIKMINVAQVGGLYYPLFACISMRRNIFANILGFLYTVVWLVISMFSLAACVGINLTDEYFYSRKQIILNTVLYIPVLCCYITLLVAYVMDFVINIRNIRRRRTDTENILGDNIEPKDSLSRLYVRKLFLRDTRRTQGKFIGKLKHQWKSVKMPGLKYSPRVVCTMFVATFILIKSTIEVAFEFDVLMKTLEKVVQHYGPELLDMFDINGTDVTLNRVQEGVFVTRISLAVCNALSLAVHIVFIGVIVVSYRNHVTKYILGDRSWHYKTNQSPSSILVGSMRYAGYQIGYLLYGWIILFFFLFFILMLVIFLIIIPLRDGYTTFLIEKIKQLWPTLIISFAILFLQNLLAKYVFLQDKGAYLALTNARWYHVTSYFLFFFNILLGLFSALKRILISMVAGILFLGRLDRVLMMQGVERFDSGFRSYLGMLQTEVYHTHPILKFFVECLEEAVATRKKDYKQAKDEEDLEMRKLLHRKRVMANKWFKFITLINNPTILVERLQRLIRERNEKGENETEYGLLSALKQAQALVEKPIAINTNMLSLEIHPEHLTEKGHIGDSIIECELDRKEDTKEKYKYHVAGEIEYSTQI